MANSVADLKDALREALDKNGSLGAIKAHLRKELYGVLNDATVMSKPELSNENLVINELIREYLVFNGYRETASVFLPETGQPTTRPFDRSFLAEHLNITEGPNSRQVPLLYSLVAGASKGTGQTNDASTNQ